MIVPEQTVDSIRAIVTDKPEWYQLTESGAWSYIASTDKLAGTLQANFGWGEGRLVRKALEEAIRPKYLIEAEPEKPLIKALTDLNKDIFIWSVGDERWQWHKIEKSGAGDYVKRDNWRVARHMKEQTVKDYLLVNKDKKVLVIDDKEEMVNRIKIFEGVSGFQFDPGDPQTSSQALFKKIEAVNPDAIFVDFDGVIHDTDANLTQLGPELIVAKHFPKTQPSASNI